MSTPDKGRSWPAFNIADAAITCGVVVFALDAFRGSEASSPDAAQHDSDVAEDVKSGQEN